MKKHTKLCFRGKDVKASKNRGSENISPNSKKGKERKRKVAYLLFTLYNIYNYC